MFGVERLAGLAHALEDALDAQARHAAIPCATLQGETIRGALVDGDVHLDASFLRANRSLARDVQDLEHKSRRHDVLVDPETMAAFYEAVVPEGIHSLAAFERWRKDAAGVLRREELLAVRFVPLVAPAP